ncbi:MAG TPA: hypothetical protein VNX67_01325 [Solirubrobacteraceae bacterium]|nr:hypothetical protein [Solirubrobacteraceae bacterium]
MDVRDEAEAGDGEPHPASLARHLPFVRVLAATEDTSPLWRVASLTLLVLRHADRCVTGQLDDAGRAYTRKHLTGALATLPPEEPTGAALRSLLALCEDRAAPVGESGRARLVDLATALEQAAPDRPAQPTLAAHVRGLARDV